MLRRQTLGHGISAGFPQDSGLPTSKFIMHFPHAVICRKMMRSKYFIIRNDMRSHIRSFDSILLSKTKSTGQVGRG
jgi:hypothetical protein